MITRALALALALLVGACALIEGGCPCGSDPSDPLSQHDLSFAGDHIVDATCVCRCGNAEPEAFPKDGDCSEHEAECEDPSGRSRERVCN